jgi:hypothetical protein
MGVEGMRDGGTKDENLRLFPDLANGAAVAVVGRGTSVKPVGVQPCVKFVAPYAGIVWVGINDKSARDNRGAAQFTVMRRGPSPTQWGSPGELLQCD